MTEAVDATLTKTEKNRILRLVREYGPPAEEFEWSDNEQREYDTFQSLWGTGNILLP